MRGDEQAVVYLLVEKCGSRLKYLTSGKFRTLQIEFEELVSELFIALSEQDWKALRDFTGQNQAGQSCRLENYISIIAARRLWKKMDQTVKEIDWILPLYMNEDPQIPDEAAERQQLASEVLQAIMGWEASTCGWYEPGGGTSPHDVGNLLELHGVPVHRYEDATIFNLTSELAQGHKVIVGVDSGELWNAGLLEHVEDQLGLSGADHALLVSGIDTTDPERVNVILTDPGSGDIAKAYPLEQFIEAWKDSRCFMVATAEPAPLEFNPGMVNFDYALGHLATIGQLPYDDFQHLFLSGSEFELKDAALDEFARAVAGGLDSEKLLSLGDDIAREFGEEDSAMTHLQDFPPSFDAARHPSDAEPGTDHDDHADSQDDSDHPLN